MAWLWIVAERLNASACHDETDCHEHICHSCSHAALLVLPQSQPSGRTRRQGDILAIWDVSGSRIESHFHPIVVEPPGSRLRLNNSIAAHGGTGVHQGRRLARKLRGQAQARRCEWPTRPLVETRDQPTP